MNTEALYQQWLSIGQQYTGNVALLQQVFDMLSVAYGSTGRHYHGMQHVLTLLRDAEEEYGSNMPAELYYAIWFHDCVYSATSSDNEAQSAKLAAKYLALMQLPRQTVNRVEAMILKTANHLDAVVEDDCTAFFLDADLKILGVDAESYGAYTQAVRREYRIYPDMLYNAGRRKFLYKALAAARLYSTAKFYERYEQRARINLQNELNQLQ